MWMYSFMFQSLTIWQYSTLYSLSFTGKPHLAPIMKPKQRPCMCFSCLTAQYSNLSSLRIGYSVSCWLQSLCFTVEWTLKGKAKTKETGASHISETQFPKTERKDECQWAQPPVWASFVKPVKQKIRSVQHANMQDKYWGVLWTLSNLNKQNTPFQ